MKAGVIPAILTLLMAVLMLFPELSGMLELRLDQPLRLPGCLTGHLVHYSWRHFALDATVFLALGTVAVMHGGVKRFLAICVTAMLTVSLALPLLSPELTAYRGISGVDTALVAAAAVYLLKDRVITVRFVALATLLGILLKSLFEYRSGISLFAGNDLFEPVASAHIIGMLCGSVVAVVAIFKTQTEVLQ
ncbi:MAG: rhomboid family intramembrane serine protease [Victivallaceae bacterium]|nr:rhomboid family intramembrane serine protease [Victivallaceae bacterium]